MYLIIVGAGDIGTPLIDAELRPGNEVVGIEKNEQRTDAVASEYECLVTSAGATLKNTEIFEITVTRGTPIAGKTLTDAGEEGLLSDGVLMVAIGRESEDRPLTPRGNTRICANGLLSVDSAPGADPEITDTFGHYENRAV